MADRAEMIALVITIVGCLHGNGLGQRSILICKGQNHRGGKVRPVRAHLTLGIC